MIRNKPGSADGVVGLSLLLTLLLEGSSAISADTFKCPSPSVYQPCKCFTWDETDQLHRKSNPSPPTISTSMPAAANGDTSTHDAIPAFQRSVTLPVDQSPKSAPEVRSEGIPITSEAPATSVTRTAVSAFQTEVEISCRTMKTDEVSLESLFSRLAGHIQRENMIDRFTSLRIENTALASVNGSDMFHGVSFKSLDFFQNIDLDEFDLKSFNRSHVTLETLLLSGSPFRASAHFFSQISKFSKLETLILSHNHIEGLPAEVFGQTIMPNLSYIDMQGNRIKEIGARSFYGLPSIQRITLDNNFISRITNETFLFQQERSKLLLIFLRNNNLTADSFDPAAFTNTDKTIFLYLNGNQISHLKEDVFKPMLDQKNDLFIALWSNPFSCDCRSKWLLQEKLYYRKRLHGIKCGVDKKEIWDLEEQDLTC